MKLFRKALIAGAVGMALTGTANAQVLFDPDGPGGVAARLVNLFDWMPGNILLSDITPIGVAATTSLAGATVYAQAVLGTVSGPGGTFSFGGAGQITYQLTVDVTYTAGGSAGQTVINPGPKTGTLNIFFNPVANANDITGCGYGAAQDPVYCALVATPPPSTLIFTGNTTLKGSATLTDTGAPIVSLDTGAPDVDEGVLTNQLSMNTMSINVDTTFANPAFFLSPIFALPTDLEHTETGGVAPFPIPVNPSDQVAGYQISRTTGVPPNGIPGGAALGLPLRLQAYGLDLINNTGVGSCGGAVDPITLDLIPCDVHLASDASSTVLGSFVPEPHSLALLGLGLAGLGFGIRRRTRRVA